MGGRLVGGAQRVAGGGDLLRQHEARLDDPHRQEVEDRAGAVAREEGVEGAQAMEVGGCGGQHRVRHAGQRRVGGVGGLAEAGLVEGAVGGYRVVDVTGHVDGRGGARTVGERHLGKQEPEHRGATPGWRQP